MTAAASVALAAAAGAVLAADPAAGLLRLHPVAARPSRSAGRGRPAVIAVAVLVVATWTGAVLLTLAVGIAAATVVQVVSVRSAARQADAVHTAVLDLLAGLAAELRAGREPRVALATSCGSAPVLLAPVAAAARSPVTDPAAALDLVAREPGAGALADLAVTWRVVADTGAGLAGPVDRLASTARAEAAVRREVAAQLAGPRATAALLAGLPLAGVGLGAVLGADPVGFLAGTPPGRGCLLAGVLLVAAGTTWTEAIARRAGPPP